MNMKESAGETRNPQKKEGKKEPVPGNEDDLEG